MADRKREIIPLKDFVALVPVITAEDSLAPGKKVDIATKLACDIVIDYKQQKDEIEAREKRIRAPILSALKDLGFDGVEVPFSAEYSYTIAIVEKEMKTIQAELLLAAGVDPEVINKCTKVTPSTYLEARVKKVR